MNTTQIFDKLLEKRKIAVKAAPTQANSLRVSLVKKFKDYKDQMDKLGFLDPDLAVCVVSMELGEQETAKFFLRRSSRKQAEYTLLETPEDNEDATPV